MQNYYIADFYKQHRGMQGNFCFSSLSHLKSGRKSWPHWLMQCVSSMSLCSSSSSLCSCASTIRGGGSCYELGGRAAGNGSDNKINDNWCSCKFLRIAGDPLQYLYTSVYRSQGINFRSCFVLIQNKYGPAFISVCIVQRSNYYFEGDVNYGYGTPLPQTILTRLYE